MKFDRRSQRSNHQTPLRDPDCHHVPFWSCGQRLSWIPPPRPESYLCEPPPPSPGREAWTAHLRAGRPSIPAVWYRTGWGPFKGQMEYRQPRPSRKDFAAATHKLYTQASPLAAHREHDGLAPLHLTCQTVSAPPWLYRGTIFGCCPICTRPPCVCDTPRKRKRSFGAEPS